MMINRRRYMGGGGAPVPTDYIQDGLVFQLDGIDKGATDGTWVDLIGGNVFTNNGAISFDTYFYFSNKGHMNGTSMECSNQYTVEACFAPDSSFSGMVFQTMHGGRGKPCIFISTKVFSLIIMLFIILIKTLGTIQ